MSSRFFWRGDDLGLDFLNTEAVDERGDPLDLLADADALLEWAGEAGIVDAGVVDACCRLPRRSQAALLRWVHRLRSSLRALVDPTANPSAEDTEVFSAVMAEVPVRLSLPVRPEETPVASATPADRLRLALALAALDTLRLDRARIRRCESERCVLLYHDTSRNRSRRWCDMASCGNRAKAAAHYRRQRAGLPR